MSAQITTLIIAYAVTASAMLVGLLVTRAGSRAYWRWPVYSAMTMVLGVALWSLLRKHVFPPEWEVTQTQTLYYSALTLYTLVGFSIGALLGRITRRPRSHPTPQP
jgi:hypothetical protein